MSFHIEKKSYKNIIVQIKKHISDIKA